MSLREQLTKIERNLGNKLYDGLGDIATIPVDKMTLGTLGLSALLLFIGCRENKIPVKEDYNDWEIQLHTVYGYTF